MLSPLGIRNRRWSYGDSMILINEYKMLSTASLASMCLSKTTSCCKNQSKVEHLRNYQVKFGAESDSFDEKLFCFLFSDSFYHSAILTFSHKQAYAQATNTHTYTHTHFSDVWQDLICISHTHFPWELIKIRERQALNIAAFVWTNKGCR